MKIKLACVGCGYFSRFHVEAWLRIPEVELVAICDKDVAKAKKMASEFGIKKYYTDLEALIDLEDFSVLDIITPPETHLGICKKAMEAGKHIICQKPLAPEIGIAQEIVALSERAAIRFMVHENFRFQPWYRKIKSLTDAGLIGDKLHSVTIKMRMGDGWGNDAYLSRQPYFQTMPRLLIYETGIHYIDVLRYLFGDIKGVFARLRKLNPVIAGEDCALVLFDFKSGGQGMIDANRFNESSNEDPRYTFGETIVEGNEGTIRLYADGRITLQRLGEKEQKQTYLHEKRNFASDCVYHTQRHFVSCFIDQKPFETSGRDYLRNLEIQEAVYESNRLGQFLLVE